MLDHGRAAVRQQYADHVDADPAGRCAPVGLDPPLGEIPQPLRLLRGHGRHRMLEGTLPAGLHLADDQDVTVRGHDVDLTRPAGAPVALHNRQTGLGQPPRGQALAVLAHGAARPMCVHVGTTSGANDHAPAATKWILVDSSAAVDKPLTHLGERH